MPRIKMRCLTDAGGFIKGGEQTYRQRRTIGEKGVLRGPDTAESGARWEPGHRVTRRRHAGIEERSRRAADREMLYGKWAPGCVPIGGGQPSGRDAQPLCAESRVSDPMRQIVRSRTAYI